MDSGYSTHHSINEKARQILRYIGPGILITVGFIDPGNWASNMAAGAQYGYNLLWIVTLSTIMLIFLQHNVAHLGIVTGKCLSEAATEYLPVKLSRFVLITAVLASISTALAEILGGGIAISILTGMLITISSACSVLLCFFLMWSNSYRKLEKIIIAFVSIIGFSFIAELSLVDVDWGTAAWNAVVPSIPDGSIPIIMSILGAVVMPHNLFLHSEIIQSRQWNLEDETVIKTQLKYEFLDTLLSMGIGWMINSAMVLVVAAVFFTNAVNVEDIQQAQVMLEPLLGKGAALIFAFALLFSGIASTTTAGMAGGSIYAGIFGEAYDIKDYHSWHGVAITYLVAWLLILVITDPFQGLIYSQIALSMQLPITVFLQIYLTSSKRVMGKYANTYLQKSILAVIALVITGLNILLLQDFFG